MGGAYGEQNLASQERIKERMKEIKDQGSRIKERIKEIKEIKERIKAFEVANRYHLIHSVALLGLPMVHRPRLAGALMVGGMAVFCGSCYYHALTGGRQLRKFTPYGG